MSNSLAKVSWCADICIGEGDDEYWVYRRDRRLRLAWSDALRTSSGCDYLAPELQLLFKSTTIRPKDQRDAEEVVPVLDDAGRRLLMSQLPGDHPWRALLDTDR